MAFTFPKTFKHWLSGLIASTVGAAANAVGVVILDPTTFNLQTGKGALGEAILVFAIVGMAQFLKAHPVPDELTPSV